MSQAGTSKLRLSPSDTGDAEMCDMPDDETLLPLPSPSRCTAMIIDEYSNATLTKMFRRNSPKQNVTTPLYPSMLCWGGWAGRGSIGRRVANASKINPGAG